MHRKDNKQNPTNAGYVIPLQNGKLTLIASLGNGIAGQVYSATYEGNDPKIIAMGNPVAVKMGEIDNDVKIANNINEVLARYGFSAEEVALFQQHINSGYQPEMPEGVERVLISTFTDCGNLESFLEKAIANKLPGFTAENNGLAKSSADIAHSLYTNLASLHNAGYYHFDIGARNVLIFKSDKKAGTDAAPYTTRLNDFGLSRAIPPEGTIPYDGKMKVPIISTTTETYVKSQLCITNDLFAFRLTLLEMLGIAVGKTSNEVLMFDDLSKQKKSERINNYVNRRMAGTDSSVMAILVNQLENTSAANDNYKQIMLFLNAFKTYLTTMPEYTQEELTTRGGISKIRKRDAQLFYNAELAFKESMKQLAAQEVTPASPSNSPSNLDNRSDKSTNSADVSSQSNMADSRVNNNVPYADLPNSLNMSPTSTGASNTSSTDLPIADKTQPSNKTAPPTIETVDWEKLATSKPLPKPPIKANDALAMQARSKPLPTPAPRAKPPSSPQPATPASSTNLLAKKLKDAEANQNKPDLIKKAIENAIQLFNKSSLINTDRKNVTIEISKSLRALGIGLAQPGLSREIRQAFYKQLVKEIYKFLNRKNEIDMPLNDIIKIALVRTIKKHSGNPDIPKIKNMVEEKIGKFSDQAVAPSLPEVRNNQLSTLSVPEIFNRGMLKEFLIGLYNNNSSLQVKAYFSNAINEAAKKYSTGETPLKEAEILKTIQEKLLEKASAVNKTGNNAAEKGLKTLSDMVDEVRTELDRKEIRKSPSIR